MEKYSWVKAYFIITCSILLVHFHPTSLYNTFYIFKLYKPLHNISRRKQCVNIQFNIVDFIVHFFLELIVNCLFLMLNTIIINIIQSCQIKDKYMSVGSIFYAWKSHPFLSSNCEFYKLQISAVTFILLKSSIYRS